MDVTELGDEPCGITDIVIVLKVSADLFECEQEFVLHVHHRQKRFAMVTAEREEMGLPGRGGER